ncbi:SMI1/KNR4 family protein [Microbacteriaceae bacterium 4G12]
MKYFDGFDFSCFWDDCEYARDEYISEYPTDEVIMKLETELGYKLPESYIWLMKQHNGGIPIKDCLPTDTPTSWAEDHVAVAGIYGIGYQKGSSLGGEYGSKFWLEEWEYPEIGVAICDCPSAGHDMIFLDYRECGPQGEPCVVHVDQEDDFKITWLAKDFESFIRGLVSSEVFEDEE